MILLIILVLTQAEYEFDYNKSDDELFEEYIQIFNKKYKDEEEMKMRKDIILNFLKVIKEQRKNGNYGIGFNENSDKNSEELHPLINAQINLQEEIKNIEQQDLNLKSEEIIPDNYFSCNKTGDDLCGEPVDQGYCGSCYACSIVNSVQIQYAKLTKEKTGNAKKEVFSPQQIIDCYQISENEPKEGCKGGDIANAIASVSGYELNSEYKYEDYYTFCKEIGYDKMCTQTYCDFYGYDSNSEECTKLNYELSLNNLHECRQRYSDYLVYNDFKHNYVFHNASWEDIKKIIYTYKSFVAGIDARFIEQGYLSNYVWSCPYDESNIKLNHAVVVDGYGIEKDIEGKEVRYLWIRNSWGKGGHVEDGHFKLNFDKSCGVTGKIKDYNGNWNYVKSTILSISTEKVGCGVNCKDCFEGFGCVECKNGSFYKNGECIRCMDNCYECFDSNTCNKCIDNYEMDNENSKCVAKRATGDLIGLIFDGILALLSIIGFIAFLIAIVAYCLK